MIGYIFFKENKFLWRKHHGTIIPLSMPHIDPEITNQQAKKLLKKYNASLIRWDTNFDSETKSEWWHIIKTGNANISDFKSKIRNMVKRGNKRFMVKLCTKKYIKENAYQVYKESYERYNTFEGLYKENKFRKSISELPNETEFWGVFNREDNSLVGFSENLVCDDACFYVTMWLKPESMKHFSSYALIYEMNKYYLNEKKLRYVSDGARGISHQTGIHDFLISKFGFRKAYGKLHVVYKPWLAFIIIGLFPIQKLIKKIKIPIFQKISILLEQERIRRSCLNNM